MDIIDERGISTLASGWRWQRTPMVSLNGAIYLCSELMHILFKRTPLHEQGLVCGVIVLMEMG